MNIDKYESIFWKIAKLKKLNILLKTENDENYNQIKKIYDNYSIKLINIFGERCNVEQILECGKNVVSRLIMTKTDIGKHDYYINSGHVDKYFKITETLLDVQSKYQSIQIHQSKDFGKILVIDGDLQFTERDEFIYHEMMVHVPMALINSNKIKPAEQIHVLVIGGGDGGVTRELLKYENVIIDQIEIDEIIVKVCLEYFPEIAESLKDNRVNLVIEDAAVWVDGQINKNSHKYDFILMDTTDFNAANPLFRDTFFAKLKNIISSTGFLVFNGTSLNWFPNIALNLRKQQLRFFNHSRIYQAFLPMYGDGHFCFSISSNHKDPLQIIPNFSENILTEYYCPEIHQAAFKLPNYLEDMLYESRLGEIKLGNHATIDMTGMEYQLLNSEERLINILEHACVNVGGLIVVNKSFHKFEPHGVTACLLLSTSHATIHTWPENNKCAIDIFTCGECNLEKIIDNLVLNFKPSNYFVNYVNRYI